MTAEDAAIYSRMPLVGRLMVHRDRVDARVMQSIEQIKDLTGPIIHSVRASYGLEFEFKPIGKRGEWAIGAPQ
jgi:hypothetical protein